MGRSISRREVLGNIACAGAGALLASGKISAQTPNILIAGRPVGIGLAQVSSYTIRLSIVPIENGQPESIPNDGSIVAQASEPPRPIFTALTRTERISLGKLAVTISSDPLTINTYENHRLVQRLVIDKQTGVVSFDITGGPMLGLGEGGPQFDRRGNKDEMRNGED